MLHQRVLCACASLILAAVQQTQGNGSYFTLVYLPSLSIIIILASHLCLLTIYLVNSRVLKISWAFQSIFFGDIAYEGTSRKLTNTVSHSRSNVLSTLSAHPPVLCAHAEKCIVVVLMTVPINRRNCFFRASIPITVHCKPTTIVAFIAQTFDCRTIVSFHRTKYFCCLTIVSYAAQ